VSLYLLVCGSRDWKDRGAIVDVFVVYVAAEPDVRVVTGGARGADTIAHDYAMSIGLATKVMPADWDRLGKRAGYVRNEAMLDLLVERACDGHAVAVEAFTDGSPGTQHTIDGALRRALPLTVHRSAIGSEAAVPPVAASDRVAEPSVSRDQEGMAAPPP